ncbi:PHD finger protein 21B isoform X2 [Pungitius pungitius]|uniref:PHD finger protein 21B isoform X2 n=1 Tax=Pungitius pungitius TaxID=134920 RepID=UPI002E153EE4
MEVRGLQEALKVEIQCHQDGELKRQLHDRRISALSDKQNQTLCKGLNELQNGQKLAVRSCPVGSTKPLTLIKPPSQSIAISVVPAKAPVSMVTAHINGQKAASSDPLQTSPINLQTGGRVASAGVHAFSSRRAGELPPSQMLGTLTAVPIKVPQVSSLHRLAGQAATVLPQVRPKTQIPDSLPQGPAPQLQPVSLQRAVAVVTPRSQGPSAAGGPTAVNPTAVSPRSQGPSAVSPRSQGPSAVSPRSQGPSAVSPRSQGPSAVSPRSQGPSAVSPRSQGPSAVSPRSQGPSATGGPTAVSPIAKGPTAVSPIAKGPTAVSPRSQGPTLPTANSTFSPDQQPSRQSDAPLVHGPSGGPDSDGPVQQALAGPGVAYAIIASSPAPSNGSSAASEGVKVIIIQPQAPSSPEGAPADPLSHEAPPAPTCPSHKKGEDPKKVAFMVALGLVTTEHLEEIQTKRQERKRRSTANPAYSGLFEPERKRLASHYLNSSLFLSARDSEDFSWKEDVEHEDLCAVCKEDGELQPCHNCPRAFHPDCLHPPLKTPPRGPWYCPKCQKKVLNKENMSWPHNFVQSYVTHKTVRQEEKRRLLRRSSELKKEFSHLEEEDEKLSDSLKQCMDLRERLLGQQRDTQASLERLKALIRLIQRDQLIQVTMTTTATIAAASLLSQSWIKPTSAAPPGPSATPLLQKSHAHSQEDVK